MNVHLHNNKSLNLVFQQTSIRAKKRILKEFVLSLSQEDTQQYNFKIEQINSRSDLDKLAVDILTKGNKQ